MSNPLASLAALERRAKTPAGRKRRRPLRLAGVSEVAEILGVTKQYASQIASHPPRGFPEPIERLKGGPVWDRRKVEDYAARKAA